MYLSIYHTVQFQYNFGTHPMSVYKFDNAENKFGNICGFRYMIISHNLFRIFCAYIYIHHMVSHLYMNGFCFSNNCMCVCVKGFSMNSSSVSSLHQYLSMCGVILSVVTQAICLFVDGPPTGLPDCFHWSQCQLLCTITGWCSWSRVNILLWSSILKPNHNTRHILDDI